MYAVTSHIQIKDADKMYIFIVGYECCCMFNSRWRRQIYIKCDSVCIDVCYHHLSCNQLCKKKEM